MVSSGFPLDREKLERIIKENRVDIANASIRQVNIIVKALEQNLGVKFIRMEFGVPGLKPDKRALDFECEKIAKEYVVSDYPPFNGTDMFRESAARFVKSFMGIDIPSSSVVATCGAQQGCFLSLAITGRINPAKRTVVFIDPGFSVNKLQVRFLDLASEGIDLYERHSFINRLEKRLSKKDVASVLWSSPNNPSWNVLSEAELERMGKLFTGHDVIGIEDNAYLGMDFRTDYSEPGRPPFVPSIADYTDNYIFLLSASKIFNYAGQRVGCAVISPKLALREYPNLGKYFATSRFLDAFVQGGIYPTTSGVAHSAQLAVAHMMDLACKGNFNFLEPLKVYAERAAYYRRVMTDNGFSLVYATDGDKPLADGFYFTASYPGMAGHELLKELLRYGISVTTLNTFGSIRTEGIRICVSLAGRESYDTFRQRIEEFRRDHV